MRSLARPLRTAAGQTIVPGKELGDGGEGAVFEVEGHSNLAVKIYHEAKRASRADKVASMTSAGWHTTAKNVAFPIDPLFDQNNKFVGFTMRRVVGHQLIHNLYSPTSRKTSFPNTNNFRFLLRTASNVARSLANVHNTGCVVGDINQRGILVANDATTTWIDCDSFQVNAGGRMFPCTVGVPEFTSPELQGKPLDKIARTVDHDAFGLAVIIFNLLFMGRHPFSGRFLSRGEMPLEKAIEEFRFAYSARKNATRMEPPPGVPLLTDIPPDMRDAFEAAFGPAGVKTGRPKAADWVRLIESAEKEMISCKANVAHHYFQSAPSCPWCRMEVTFPGFVAFTATTTLSSFNPSTLAELIAAIRTAPDPGPAPNLAATMPVFQGTPSRASIAARNHWMGPYIAGILGVLIGFELMHLPAPGPVAGVILFLGGAFLAWRKTDPKVTLQSAVTQASKAWQAVENQWRKTADNQLWLAKRREADDQVRRLQRLSGEEANRMAGLKAQQRDRQLRLFLERYHISQATIKLVGDGRKATLRSYGIETAADIEQSRIESISGFGPVIVGELLSWRASIERYFIFDSTRPINPADIRAIKNDIARQSADLVAQLRQSLSELQRVAAGILGIRASFRTSAVIAWNRLKQCELDAAACGNLPSLDRRRGIFAAISVASFLAVQGVNSFVHAPLSNIVQAGPKGAPAEITEIQTFLQRYGFLTAAATGTWDQATREALGNFKAVNGLTVDGTWDGRMLQQLNASTVINADQSFIGKWGQAAQCDGKLSGPVFVIDSRQAKSSTGVLCEFQKIDHDATGWQVSAACTVENNKPWTSTIRLSVQGSRLFWISDRDNFSYYRCH
jgi:DNA-binding helix-hairpin-helix protein with protein kinase domain